MARTSAKMIGKLINDLESLRNGERAVVQLIKAGSEAVGPLRQLLLEGRPGVTYQPRQWAVQGLAGIGAKDVLVEYLQQRKDIPDPATRLAEEAVEITAARALKPWASEREVCDLLLRQLSVKLQPGAIDTLGEARQVEAVPYFIQALEDDVCRRSAEEALLKLGSQARDALMAAALERSPSAQDESPSSLLRRRSALELLSNLLLPRNSWRALTPGLDDKDIGIVVATAKIAAKPGCGNLEDKRQAVIRLVKLMPFTDSFMRVEAEGCLATLLSQYQAHAPKRR